MTVPEGAGRLRSTSRQHRDDHVAVTITAHRVVSLADRAGTPDPGRLEQILRLQESLLLGDISPTSLGGRICQGTALLLYADAARLVLLDIAGIETVASYGTAEFANIDAPAMRTAITEGRPAIPGSFDGRSTLAIPLQTGDVPVLLEIVGAPGRTLGPDDIALARYAGALATIALRHAAQRERLEQSSRTKSEVLVTMSHDLRSPLNVLIGYTRMLSEDAFGACSPEQREALGSVERYALELLSLLSGVLDLARLDAGREPHREEFALADVFDELKGGSLATRAADGVELAWEIDPELPALRSDRFRVRQILQNLVDNALRFTEHGSVCVSAARANGGVQLTVSDTGPGIAASDVPHLFELFRPGAATRGASTGCGLYLVKRFSESLGGRVRVQSTPGEGTRFTIDLPLQ